MLARSPHECLEPERHAFHDHLRPVRTQIEQGVDDCGLIFAGESQTAERTRDRSQDLLVLFRSGAREERVQRRGAIDAVERLSERVGSFRAHRRICIIEVPRENRAEVFNKLYHEHGIAASTTGGLRLCPHVYNTLEHVKRAAAGVKSMRNLIG